LGGPCVSGKVLVVVIGQPRGGHLAHLSLLHRLVIPHKADLALYFGEGSDTSSILFKYAKYHWVAKEYPDWTVLASDFEKKCPNLMQKNTSTRKILWGHSLFVGRRVDPQLRMSGFVLLAFRWLLYQKIQELKLTSVYDAFVMTRADELYLCPHTPISTLLGRCKSCVWVQQGEEYGGFSDRHVVARAEPFMKMLNVTQSLTCQPNAFLRKWNIRNIETVLAAHANFQNISVRKFQMSSFLVRSTNDATRWSRGFESDEMAPLQLLIKYPNEFTIAKRQCDVGNITEYIVSTYMNPSKPFVLHGIDNGTRS
jgi:hypothetical protein